MGDVRLLGERADEARPHYDRALELAPDDYENQLEVAEWLHHRAETQQRLELVPQAREHYRRAIELAPQIPESHAMLGRTWLLSDEDPTPGIQSLEHARKLLPSETGLLLPLAALYQRAGRHDEAVAAARRVERWSHGELQEEAEKVLEQLGEGAPALE
jgi:tetratricopeptide (TPR) repeat protein